MGNGKKKLLILSEAGDGIGYGHYTRCFAIKSYIEERGVPTDFFLDVKGAQSSQFKDVSMVDWQFGVEHINKDRKYSHVLMDSYLAPLSIFNTLRAQFEKVVALDDYHRIDMGPHLIINPNIFGDKVKYHGLAVGGSGFIILRNAFRNETRKFSVREELGKILITLGGSDFRKLAPAIVNIVRRINSITDVEVVAGNDEYCDELKALFTEKAGIHLHAFAGELEMKRLMLASDITISGCGQTLHELARLGVPTIGICVGDDQIMNMKEYVSRKFLNEELYWNSRNFSERVESNINQLKPADERKRRSEIAERILDNKGLDNIYHEIFS
jgi:spore coat polysaccharide biosynthesis predicted glycosyltransferase SpsG